MIFSRKWSWLWLSVIGVVLASVLLFLYLKSRDYAPDTYFESLALLRQIRQLDAQWELAVLRSKTGVNKDYDALVDPLAEMDRQWPKLDALESGRMPVETERWGQYRAAYLNDLKEKTRLIEAFKSHNAVLRNSLAFLPTAEGDVQDSLKALNNSGNGAYLQASMDVYDITLTTFEFVQSSTDDRKAEVEAGIARLLTQREHLPVELQGRIDVLVSHVRAVLRELPIVFDLMGRISQVPIARHLDEIGDYLGREQLVASQQDQRYRHFLLTFATVLALLLLYLASRLIRSYTIIQRVNRELQAANEGLEMRVADRTRDLQRVQSELMTAARHAGMAEIATNVLHNVGNVLNSVNISADLVSRTVRGSRAQGLVKAVQMMNDNADNLGEFLSHDERGKLLPGYLNQLVEAMELERKGMIDELAQLTTSVDHIKDIVATQQSYAGSSSLIEPLYLDHVIEDALRMNSAALVRHHVDVVKDYNEMPRMLLDKHRMLLILINLISNAKYAMSNHTEGARVMTISAALVAGNHLRISVKDQGEGISAENLKRIFTHGFTTRKEGHGFGLHSCALAAREMNGVLSVHSDGVGLGAVFTLEIPVEIQELAHAHQ
ncbi:DAHL domain-containing protein [Pseudomonas sp. LFM046]|uniref:DAHL domain-containing protein n=1 Tax=Pseudomonas sp. LFM046 TaxID=1608357 RepID=UPI0005CFE614|nr:DAHL domain-containing protein [Pseudomonas sp. LFM046]